MAWRAALIGLALHAVSLISGTGAAPDTARILLFEGPALAAAAAWSRARPVVPSTMTRWERAGVEALAVGPSAALFAVLLGWASAYPH
jgi:hypothetical protein